MYPIDIKLNLQVPWKNENFEMSEIGYINYLVGPNGAGKSQFSEHLKFFFDSKNLKCRILSADRLTGFGFSSKNINSGHGNYVVSQSSFHDGFNKQNFSQVLSRRSSESPFLKQPPTGLSFRLHGEYSFLSNVLPYRSQPDRYKTPYAA